MDLRTLLLLGLLALPPLGVRGALAPAATGTPESGVLLKFEREVEAVSGRYGKLLAETQALAAQVNGLNAEAEKLRDETRGQGNVLKEAQLKGALGNLQRALERQAKM